MDSSQSGSWSIDQPDQVSFDGPVRALKLAVAQGRINVIGTDGPPTLEVTRISGRPLTVELADGLLTVRQGEEGKPNVLGWLLSGRRQDVVDLSLALPPDALVELNVVSGAVVVSNFHEQVAVRGVSGDITLAGVHGTAKVNTVSGAITAEQVTGDIKVNAISGAITVIAGAGGRIDLNTVSGALTLDLEDPMPTDVSLQCVSGALTIRLPYQPDVKVELNTAHGRVATSFDELSKRGWHNTQQLTGQLGTGAARLRGSTVSGAVTLLRRSAEDDYSSDLEDDIPSPVRDERSADDQNGEGSR
jgi:Putative adhesin